MPEAPDVTPRLILITPPVADPAAFAANLEAALGAADVAAVILRLGPADDRTLLARAKQLVTVVQAANAAALLDELPDLVGRSGADGLHAHGAAEAVAEAIERFHPEKIVGVGALRSRDLAMDAGEAGADYLLFGEPGADGTCPPFDDVLERAAWWVEIFAPPCAVYAPRLEDVRAAAETGAEFVALGDAVWEAPAGAAAAVRSAAAALVHQDAP